MNHKYENNVNWVGKTVQSVFPIKNKDGFITEIEVGFSDGGGTRFWAQDNVLGVVTIPNYQELSHGQEGHGKPKTL